MTLSLETIVNIHELKRQGYSISAIARATGRDRKTVRKYLKQGLKAPTPTRRRRLKPRQLEPFEDDLTERIKLVPGITARRLLRDLRAMGYNGSYATVTAFLRRVRPQPPTTFVPRFETPPGRQAQVDFAEFKCDFSGTASAVERVWLFSMVLGASRWMWGRFCTDQKQQTLLRMPIHAFEAMGGVPAEILPDRMKTAVSGTASEGAVRDNPAYVDMLGHYGSVPRACRPYRAATKGKVERSFGYVRSDFYPGRTFCNLDDLNGPFNDWRDDVANRRRHATTGRIVKEAYEAARPALLPLPPMPWNGVITLPRRRVSKDGMVSVEGNLYSAPDGLTGRHVQVQVNPHSLCIIDANGAVVATHRTPEGGGRVVSDPTHRRAKVRDSVDSIRQDVDRIAVRDLSFYGQVGVRLASGDRP